MNSSFNILTPGADTSQSSLLIEICRQGISYLAISETNTCIALSIYHFEAGTTNDQVANYLKDIFASQPFLQKDFKKISFIYAFNEAELVPHQFMNIAANKEILDFIYGDTTDRIIRTDLMYRHNLHNIYGVPKQVDSVVAHLFPKANHFHLYSLLPDVTKVTGNQLYCIFSTSYFTLQLLKDGKLQLIKSFDYKFPEDVVYHILNACQSFGVTVNETTILLNGMIDAESGLYNELHKYFSHPKFGALPEQFNYSEDILKYPSHYFSHLFELAACV